MAIGIDLAFNPPLPEVQLHSDGKLLGTNLDLLERLAEVAGVQPLGAFSWINGFRTLATICWILMRSCKRGMNGLQRQRPSEP